MEIGGNGTGNRKSIGIEICYSKSGGERFEQAERLAAEYTAMLLKQYGWGIDRVKKHQDWSGKYCPHRTLDMGWDRFLNMVRSYLDGVEPAPQPAPSGDHLYANGSTSEIIYADTALTKRIGSLNPWEQCYCYGIFNGRPLVRYQVGNTGVYKIGWARWVGGVRNTGDVNITNRYQNGSTRENIFANTNCSMKIGSLDPREQCDCLGLFNDRPVVIYRVNGTNNYKTGFAIWKNRNKIISVFNWTMPFGFSKQIRLNSSLLFIDKKNSRYCIIYYFCPFSSSMNNILKLFVPV